jgi:hypothetical protein
MAEISIYSGSDAHGRAPGVYIQDIAPSPGAVIATGVPLFIGFAQFRAQFLETDRNKKAKLVRLGSWEQFEQSIGPTVPGSFLGYAVRGFFENGGERCVVVPLRLNEDQLKLMEGQLKLDQDHLRTNQDQSCRAVLTNALEDLFRKDANDLRSVLSDIDDTDLVCVPDIMMKDIWASEETVFELQKQVLEYCKDMGERFAILDALPGDAADIEENLEKSIRHWQELVPTEGALYFPWVRVKSLNGPGEQWVPPCGHVAGIYARTDARVGFHKAPANEIIEGVLDLQSNITQEIQSQLNEIGVNCLRSFARRGIRVWGARTLSGHRNWRYVNVRRIFLTLVRWIEHNMNDLVFEPNEPSLWDRVRDRLGGYCYELFERGALKGRDPAEAFFVKCDAELNPLDVREAGQLICEVGLAPLTPAEFILIRITQSAAGTTVTLPTG